MRIKLGEVSLQCLVGDISDQPGIDAVVNAANADLVPGGGVAGALHAKAGPELAAACAPHAPIPAISTGSFGYPMPEAADVACATVAELASNLLNVRLVRFVLFDQDALRVFSAKLIRATGRLDDSQSPQRA